MIILDNEDQIDELEPCYKCGTINVIYMDKSIDENIFCECGRRKGAYYKIKNIRYITIEVKNASEND